MANQTRNAKLWAAAAMDKTPAGRKLPSGKLRLKQMVSQQLSADLLRGCHDSYTDWQIKAWTFLAQISWRQVDTIFRIGA